GEADLLAGDPRRADVRPHLYLQGHVRSEQAVDQGPVQARQQIPGARRLRALPQRSVAELVPEPAREAEHRVRLEGHRLVAMVVDPHVAVAVRAAVRFLDLPDEPGAGRRLESDVVRQVAREANDSRLPED